MGRFLAFLACLTACSFENTIGRGDSGGNPTEWAWKRKLTIDNTPVPSPLTGFALAIHLDANRISYGKAKPDGADIRIGDASGKFFPHEIEQWNSNGASMVWANVPAIPAAGMTDIWLYYGNANATDAQKPADVWDDQYVGVWHMADGKDATGSLQSTQTGGQAMPGKLGNALVFDAPGQFVDTKSTEHLQNWTIEVWMNPPSDGVVSASPGPVVSRNPNYIVLWGCTQAPFCKKVLYTGSAGSPAAGYDVAQNSWTHVAGSYDGAVLRAFVNGIQSNMLSTTSDPQDTTGTAKIGCHPNNTGQFFGGIDEVRISRVARSREFIRAHVRSTSDQYITYGPEEPN